MICKTCGQNIEDSEQYCPNCGSSIKSAQEALPEQDAPEKPESSKKGTMQPVISDALTMLKTFFSSRITDGIVEASHSKSYAGAIFAAAYIILFALSAPLLMLNLLTFDAGTVSVSLGDYCSYEELIPVNLLIGVIYVAVVLGFAFAYRKLNKCENSTVLAVLNTVGYSLIPVITALILNFVLSFVWLPLSLICFILAAMIQMLLLYREVQQSEKFPTVGFAVVSAVCIGLVGFIACKLYSETLANVFQRIVSSMFGRLFGR